MIVVGLSEMLASYLWEYIKMEFNIAACSPFDPVLAFLASFFVCFDNHP